ncbi:MAG: hypothetical protein DI589_25915 [Shinella sp.]|nr:MAG: hypothetical protein DI589_25915 [Shinella sp.]
MTDQAQCDELLAALTKRPMTATEIFLELGIARASARIYDLRQQGHPIHSTEIVVKNRIGKPKGLPATASRPISCCSFQTCRAAPGTPTAHPRRNKRRERHHHLNRHGRHRHPSPRTSNDLAGGGRVCSCTASERLHQGPRRRHSPAGWKLPHEPRRRPRPQHRSHVVR